MYNLVKKISTKLPVFLKIFLLSSREYYFRRNCLNNETREGVKECVVHLTKEGRKKILVYHITGLSYGGTEKNLQIIANDLVNHYDVYYMYSNTGVKSSRESFMDKRINLIEFTYKEQANEYPYYVSEMKPHIKDVISERQIDMIIVSETGHTVYPVITIKDIPIIMINNFGAPTVQKNIVHINYVSETVKKHAQAYTGTSMKYSVLNTPTTSVYLKNDTEDLRKKLNIKESDFVFGRIGRNSDDIFDPIGIQAFKKIQERNKCAHFIIVSPPPKLEKMVREENIPRVHLISTTTDEKDVWSFHYAIDALAHFRYDGETLGLNIAESMKVGNPIITHVSHVWNAHLDYLEPSFSRVAKMDDVDEYASYMEEFINIKKTNINVWQHMRDASQDAGTRLFTKETYMEKFREIVKVYL